MAKQLETKQHFGIRKLTTGAASVLLATTFLMTGHGQTVHADTIDDNTNHDQAENHDQLPENDTKDFTTQSENDVQQNSDEQQTDAQNKNINDTDEQQKASVKTETQTMSVKVHYTDETGKEVASETVTGKQGDNIKFTLPKGYQAVNPDILKQTFEDQLEITIPISKLVHETSDKREWSPSSDNQSNVDKTIKNTKHDDTVTKINNNVNNQSNDAQAKLSGNPSTSADNNKNQSANTLTNSQNTLTENKNKIKYAINNPVDKQANIAVKTSKLKVVDSVANMHKIGTVDERANEKLFETSLIQLAAVEKSNSSINKAMAPNQLDQSIFLAGTKWTPAGWTRANPQFVAKKAHLDFAFVDHDQWDGRDWFVHYVNQKHAPTITATLRKEDIHKGNQILLAAIQSVKDNQQTNDQINLYDSGYMGAGGTDVYLKDQRIGHIYALNHDLGEVDYYLSIDTDIKVASDPEISWTDKSPVSLVGYYVNRVYHNGIDLGNDWPLFAKNIGSTYHVITSNGIQDIPFIATPNAGSKLPDNGNYKSNYIDPSCPGTYFGGAVYSNLNPNKTQMGVFKMTSSENLINFNGQPGIAIRTRYHDVYNDKFYPSANPSDNSSNPNPWLHLPATKKADNLSNIELLNQTPNDSITYSKTNNGYLVAYKFSPKLLATKGEAYVRPITEYGYDTNISLKDANRDDVIKQTLDYYRQRDFVPSSIDFLFSVPTTRGDKNDILTVSDITPNFNGQTSISNHNSNNSSLDAALYRSIPIQYIDIDNNNAIVGNDTIIGITDKDLTVTPFNLSIPKNYVAQNWDKIDYGVVHDKNNRTLVIPVKHKIIGTASNLKENANSGRDYELDRIRNEDFNNLINDIDNTTGFNQHLEIGLNPDDTCYVEILDPSFAHFMNDTDSLTVLDHHGHKYTHNRALKLNERQDHSGAFAKVTYTNLKNASYDGKPISKIEITYSNWKYSPVAFDPFGRGAALYTDSDVAEGFSFEHAKNVDADIKLFDENGKQITFNKESYVTFGSLNSKGKNSDYIESVTLHSQGKGIAIPGSSVSVHNDGKMIYSDYDNDQPEWNPNGFWDVPDPKDPRYHVGAGIFNVTNSDHIKVSYGSGSVNDPNKWNQTGGGFMWATWSTTIPTTNAQYQGYSQNIHIIKDPVQIIEANADDQQSINNAFDKINQDYSNQAKTINDQVTDYVQKMNNYVQKRKAFIQKLKNEGLWQEGMVDPESVKQSFHLNLDSHNNSIVPKVIWYDINKVKLDSPQQVGFLTDDAIIGAFATVEYTGIQNSYYRNTPITKMTVTYSNVKPGTKSIGSWLTIRTGINNGLSYGHITGLDLDIKFYDENDNQITFDNDAYISVGSLNGYNNEATESVKLLSNGTILPMPQSAVRIHKDGSAYMDDGYVTPASIGLPDSFNSWDNSTDPNRIFGTALVHFQGNHLKLRAFKQMDNVLNTNNSQRTFNGTPWFIWSTMLPPLSFNEPKPELTIHYHNDKLDEHLKRNYSINENLPTPADYNDKYTNVYGNNTNKLNYDLNLSRTEAKDLVTNQKQSASWVLPHFYAQDNQGNIHDLGQGVYSKNPTNGQWGFWNIFDKYQNSQYNVNPNQFLSPAGKGIITLPGYKLITNNDHNSEAATKFDNQSSWIIYNVNGENGISKLENLITNIDLQPTTHVNNIDVIDLDSKNQKSSFADKIKPIYTDTTDSISVADNNLINLDNNLKNYYQRMLENKIIDHIQINDNIIYFNYENGNWSIKSTNWGNLSLTDFEKKAQQEHLNLRNFNLKPVTTSDGTKAGLDSQITVADQNVLSNGQWQTDVPHIQIYVKNKIKRPAEEYDNTDTINHHYIIHYQIPKQIQDDVQYDNGDVYYDIMAHHEYYTYSYLDTNCNYWSDPIYGTLPDGSFGVVSYTDPVPHPEEKWATEDLGWIEDDDPNNNANYIGVDDLLSSDLNNAPFVVDNTDASNIVDNYQLHIYGVNNLGQKIDLTNGSHLITQNGKLYFAPYYNKINGQKDPYLSTKLDDSEFGNDIWVTYEPLTTQRQITYVDIHDYDEPKTLKSYYVTGKEGDQTHLNIVPNTPAGYEIDDDQELPPNDYTFNYETDGDPIIVYVHAKEQIDNNVSPFKRHVIFDTTQMAPEDRNKDIYIDWNNDSTSVSSFHNYDKQADADLVFNYKGRINPITNEHIGNWSVTTTNNDNQLLKAGIDPKSKGQELISLLEGSIHVPDGYYAYLDDPSESVTSIPANTLDHLITNSNLIIHIAPIGRNTQIKYVDSLTNETVATGKIITGNLGDKYQTDLTLPDHYSLSKQQTDTNVKITSFTTPQAIITVNKSAQAVIYVNADVIYVDHHNPKKPDDIMITDPDVPEITTNYPVGVDDDYLNKYINETVEFHYPDGSVDSKQQKVHFYRNALINLVTGEITYVDNDRKVLLNDQWAIEGPNNFKDVLIPTKSGMMPKAHIVSGKPGQISLTKISGLTPHVTDDNIKVVIDYSKVNNYKTIVLVDDDATMREITRFNINGNTSFNIPDGYLLANSYNNNERNEIINGDWDSLSNTTNNGNPDLITIHLIENMKNITDTDAKAHLNIKRQVVIVNPDNTRDSMTMTIELERQAIYNEVTKKISYGNWYVKQIPVTTYDHTLDNGDDEDSGIESFDLYNYKYDEELDNPSAVNTQILKYFGDYENVNNFIKQLNNHTELIIPAIHIPDKAGYAKEIDNANTDGINISNEYIPAERLLLVSDQNEKDQLGTETRDLSIINIDDHNFDEDLDKTIVVHYIQGQHEMSYHYVNQRTGQIVGGDSVLGDEGQTVDITNIIPNGYHLVNDQHNFANTYTFDNKNNVTQTVYVTKD